MTSNRSKIFFAAAFAIATFAFPSANPFAQSSGLNLPNPYKEVEDWARLPEGKRWSGSIFAPGVDSHGNVWVLTRCGLTNCADSNEPAILEFDPSGNFVQGIGRGLFAFPHGLFIDKDDNLWVADAGASKGRGNQATKLSPNGEVLMTLGKKGVMGGSEENFVGVSAILVAPNGDIFVADGHAVVASGGGGSLGFNAATSDPSHMRIVKFSKDGTFIKAWGGLGSAPGQFNTPHAIAMDSQGRLFVADRGNNRIQIFDQNGKFLNEWKQFGKPVSVYIDSHDTIYAIDSDSNAGLWDWKYSSVGNPCVACIARVPRLTDVGFASPNFTQGIRIGNASDGIVRAFIPAHYGPAGPTNLPEFLVADAAGDLYVAESRNQVLRKYVKKVELPEGPGKERVQHACGMCHDFEEFPRVNFDRNDWLAVVKTMVAGGAPLKTEDVPAVADYLASSFKSATVPGVAIPGSVHAEIAEWEVPTPNSMPYGIYHSKQNGFTWYAGTFANTIGRFDPKSQQFKEYHMRPGTNPTSLVEFPAANFQGVVYFSPQAGSFIGEFHPVNGPYASWAEGDVLEHPVPSAKLQFHQMALNRFPHVVWFTVPQARPPLYPEGGKVGSLRPWSTEVKLAEMPTANADPYALAVNSNGIPFFTERDSPKLGSVNPDTMQVTEYPLPNPQSIARGVAITPDDVVWYTDYARGYLGRFDSKTGAFSEFPSPSGPRSRPYGITNVGNVIWYAESGTTPNMLVRFDPASAKFQSWPVPSGGGIRQIFADADGTLWFTRPIANGIARVSISAP